MTEAELLELASQSVVKVGGGRGFVVEVPNRLFRTERVIVTAAHCLPNLPPAHGASYPEERTFSHLLAPLGEEPTLWAECCFADPISDLAVLCAPDGQELPDECEAFETLVEQATVLRIIAPVEGPAWMLALTGDWFPCEVRFLTGGPLIVTLSQTIAAGMSGSPIVQNGGAIGAVSIGSTGSGSPEPCLVNALPGRMLSGTR